MKKNIFFISLVFTLSFFNAAAQYVSPGNNSSLTLDDLVANSNGVVTYSNGIYFFNDIVSISATDTLSILSDGNLRIHENILWTIEGVLIIDPPSSFQIQQVDGDANFQGIRFDQSSASFIHNLSIAGCGGIKLVDSDMNFTACQLMSFGQEYTTAAIDLFNSSPQIRDCTFDHNAGPAVASAANGSSSPQIMNNTINANVTVNSNTPQINLGTSDGLIPILIDGNIVDGQYDMAGGIAVATLAGGNATAVISNNQIRNNRYGVAIIGSNIDATITGNIILDNNIQGDPMQGGSGLNFYGGATNTSIVSHNIIRGNLWGITIQLNAQPNFGDTSNESPGHNEIYDNINNFQVYDLYNNTPDDIMALNNFWGTTDLVEAESFIYHQVDDASLGTVFFDPMWINPVGVSILGQANRVKVNPNPCHADFSIITEGLENFSYELMNMNGEVVKEAMVEVKNTERMDVSDLAGGFYLLKIKTADAVITRKVVKQ